MWKLKLPGNIFLFEHIFDASAYVTQTRYPSLIPQHAHIFFVQTDLREIWPDLNLLNEATQKVDDTGPGVDTVGSIQNDDDVQLLRALWVNTARNGDGLKSLVLICVCLFDLGGTVSLK